MKRYLLSFIVVLSCALVPFYASANELVKVEKMSFEGEEFELETWLGEDGVEYRTISTEVENKVGVINYLDSLKDDDTIESASITDPSYFPWRPNNFYKTDDLGKLEWGVHGWSSQGYGVFDRYGIEVARSPMKAMFLGIGNPDRITNTYSYTFRGTTMSLSYPPSFTPSANTITWKSEPVTGTWILEHDSLAASATSAINISGIDIAAYSDIYKGGKIYRPDLSRSIRWLGTGN